MTNPATFSARSLLLALVEVGVRDIVVCPGSRSAPLAFAALALENDARIRLHIRHDERVGAFTALGAAKAAALLGDPRPAVIITTSGTATANLHPALLEAHHAHIPLIALTADRPHELRGVGANQTTDQAGLFGTAVRWAADIPARDQIKDGAASATYFSNLAARAGAAALGSGGEPGPVHLNLALREPLISPDELAPVAQWPVDVLQPAGLTSVSTIARSEAHDIPASSRTVVLAGDGAGDRARQVAETGRWPLFAEPSSGARSGPNAIGPYRLMLGSSSLAQRIERVVVFGHATLSRPVQQLLAREDVEVIVVHSGANWPDPPRRARVVVGDVSVGGEPESAWLAQWKSAEVKAAEIVAHTLGNELSGPAVAQEVVRATGADHFLWFGSSNPVRDADLARPWQSGEAPLVAAHRGLAGIDGTISAATGAALASGRATRLLLGDLTFIHDLGALILGPLETQPDLQIIVFDDDGGGIFEGLEQGDAPYRGAFERIFGTPHGKDLASIARAMSQAVSEVADLETLRLALANPIPQGLSVLIIRASRDERRAQNAQLTAEVAAALKAFE